MKTKIIFDFFPVLLFFIAFKLFGIFTATAIAIAASLFQVSLFWYRHRHLESMHIITLILILVLGGATLLLHNEVFIKWKPTAINWGLAVFFLGYQFLMKKPMVQKMMEKEVSLPGFVWARLNVSWILFFVLMGVANLIVAYEFDTNTWVNFKLFGVLGLTFLFVIIQAVYLTRHIQTDHQESKEVGR